MEPRQELLLSVINTQRQAVCMAMAKRRVAGVDATDLVDYLNELDWLEGQVRWKSRRLPELNDPETA